MPLRGDHARDETAGQERAGKIAGPVRGEDASRAVDPGLPVKAFHRQYRSRTAYDADDRRPKGIRRSAAG